MTETMQKRNDAPKRETQNVQTERMRSGRAYVPAVDIIECSDRLMLIADMPGVKSDGLEIMYERGQLTLLGRVQPRRGENESYLAREYGVGDFSRAFQIGDGIDAARIEAELRDGVLTVHLPKQAKLMPRRIAVKAG